MTIPVTKKTTRTLTVKRPQGAPGARTPYGSGTKTYASSAPRPATSSRPAPPRGGRSRRVSDTFNRISAMHAGVENGTLPKDDATRLVNRILGEVLKGHKLEAEYLRLRRAGQLPALAFFDPVEHAPLTAEDLKQLKEAARIHQELTRKLGKKAAV